jgi:hypothetical protein
MLAALLLLAVSLSSIYAAQVPQNGSISIDTPMDHDLFLTGETITINARVEGDVLATGGTVIINAPVNGDLLVLAQEVTVNAPISGTVTAVGWQVRIRASVGGRILAVGGTVSVGSRALKLVALGGTVQISVATVIEEYAYVAAGTVEHNGAVMGELRVVTNDFQGSGIAGKTIQEGFGAQLPMWLSVIFRDITGPYASILVTLNVLVTLGFLVLGLALLVVFPRQFSSIHDMVLRSPVRNVVTGFLLIIGAGVTCVLFAVTLVGLPLAVISGMLLLASTMVSNLFVSLALGKKVVGAINLKAQDTWTFVLGFLILSLLSSLAVIGWVIYVAAVSLGLGAIFYTVRENWNLLKGDSLDHEKSNEAHSD